MKYIHDLMINNHKLYLLLCLFILFEANLIDNNENVYVLRLIEQIKAYLSKFLRNFKNRILVLKELKSVSKNLSNMINIILGNINYNSPELLDYISNINKVEITRLFDIFEQIKNKYYINYNNNLYNNDNTYNMNIIPNNQYGNKINSNINNNENNNNNINNNIINKNNNNSFNKVFYKKVGKVNEHKKKFLNNGLYIKKTIPNKQINNKKVTNKIINIIINNNNSNVNYDNQNQLSINYNISKKMTLDKNTVDPNNITQESNNNQTKKTITIQLNNNTGNYNIDNYNYNINNISPLYKKINYFNTVQSLESNSTNNKINTNNTNKYITNNTPNYNVSNNLFNNTNNNNFFNNNNNLINYNNYLQNQQITYFHPEPPFLPKKQNKSEISQKKYTLILDLDETLVRYKINENNPDEAKVIFRPGLFYFLNKVYPLFDIVIWTVATKEYADPIIDIIEEKKKYFIARLFREHATIKNNNYVKDLTNLGRDINTIIIIDDKETSFSLQKQNGILIKPFFGTYLELKNDFILYDLFKILTKILLDKSQDVRHGINKYQYEIKQKITKNSNKNNFDNIDSEKKDFYNSNNNDKVFINNNITNNNINNNINNTINNNTFNNNMITNNNYNGDYLFNNRINNIAKNFNVNQPINRSFSMSEYNNKGLKKFSKK